MVLTLTEPEWRLAEALQVLKMHGDRAPLFIAEQIGSLIDKGDNAGALRWHEIDTALDLYMRGTRQ